MSITTRVITAMLLVAIATIGMPALITLFSAEQQFRQPNERGREISAVLRSVEALCADQPPVGLVCPKPRPEDFAPRPSRNRSGIPFIDPRPWVAQAVIVGVSIALIMALGLALLLSKRISKPIQNVSAAAARVAHGDLSARADIQGSDRDELSTLGQNFNRMAAHLEAQATMRQNLFADIAHELRTPLSAIKARLEALEDGVMPLDLEAIQRLSGQTRLLERLVEDVRLLSLADAGTLTLELHNTDITALAKETLEVFQAKATQHQITLELHSHQIIQSKVDANRLQQAIGNLLENAIQHTPAKGRVRLELQQTTQAIEIQVSDTGSGIPPEALTRIFERLYRADASRNRATGGSGLGLAIVKTIAELHQGTVKAKNLSPHGAALCITLPL